MKKILIILTSIVLIAAACNKTPNTARNNSTAKLCGNWPQTELDTNYIEGSRAFNKIDSSTIAVYGMSLYPNTVKLIQILTGSNLQIIACAKGATASQIRAYYKGDSSVDGSGLNENYNLGSLHPITVIDNPNPVGSFYGELRVYDVGAGDLLLAYIHR